MSDLLLLGAGRSHCVPAQLAEHLKVVKREYKHYLNTFFFSRKKNSKIVMWLWLNIQQCDSTQTLNSTWTKKHYVQTCVYNKCVSVSVLDIQCTGKNKKKKQDETGTTSRHLICVPMGSDGCDV